MEYNINDAVETKVGEEMDLQYSSRIFQGVMVYESNISRPYTYLGLYDTEGGLVRLHLKIPNRSDNGPVYAVRVKHSNQLWDAPHA